MTDDHQPGDAGSAEADKRFGGPNFSGLTPVNLQAGDAGFEGLTAAEHRFGLRDAGADGLAEAQRRFGMGARA